MKLVDAYKRHFLGVELVLALLIASGFTVWCEFFEGFAKVDTTLSGNRSAIYGALASIFGTMLGFTIATVSIVIGMVESPNLSMVRRSKHYRMLWKIFSSSNRWLGIATFIALAGLILDKDSNICRALVYFNFGLMVIALFRIGRCVWVLERIVEILAQPSKAETVTPALDGVLPSTSEEKQSTGK